MTIPTFISFAEVKTLLGINPATVELLVASTNWEPCGKIGVKRIWNVSGAPAAKAFLAEHEAKVAKARGERIRQAAKKAHEDPNLLVFIQRLAAIEQKLDTLGAPTDTSGIIKDLNGVHRKLDRMLDQSKAFAGVQVALKDVLETNQAVSNGLKTATVSVDTMMQDVCAVGRRTNNMLDMLTAIAQKIDPLIDVATAPPPAAARTVTVLAGGTDHG